MDSQLVLCWSRSRYCGSPAVAVVVALLLMQLLTLHSLTVNAFPTCNVSTNCSGRAHSVTNGTADNSVCICNCTDQWSGPNCSTCPAQYNQSTCNACSANYNGSSYPGCSGRACSVVADCNSTYTSSVSGTYPNCTCQCKGKATQPRCNCPVQYNQNPLVNCQNFCAAGYNQSSYPFCYKLCTLQDCPPNTGSFGGDSNSGCWCKCAFGWTGANCSVCPPNYDLASGCSTCASGFAAVNNTCIACSPSNCSFQGIPDPARGCTCDCFAHYQGGNCDTCPIEYDPADGCTTCNTPLGYKQVGPVCQPPCTAAANCSGHAADPVLLNLTTQQCNCVCTASWNGSTCATCPYPYDPNKNCADCLAGMQGYPNCTNVTTTTTTLPPSTTTTTSNPSSTTTVAPTTTTMPPTTTTIAPRPRRNMTNTTSRSASTSITQTVSRKQTWSPSTSSSISLTSSQTVSESSSRTARSRSANRTSSWSDVPSVSATKTIRVSNTTSLTASLCAQNISDCLERTNHSVLTEPPVNCFCVCRNQWSQMFCNYCDPRYNSTDDCGSCFHSADHYFVVYPSCFYILYISGNLSVPLLSRGLESSLVRSRYFASVAQDVAVFVNETLRCARFASNISAYTIGWSEGNHFVVDIEILDLSIANATEAADCALVGLKTKLNFLNFSASAALALELGGVPTPMNATLRNPFFDLDATRIVLEHGGAATQENPCNPAWCHTIPPIVDPAVTSWVGLIAAACVLGAIGLIAGAFYAIWYKPRKSFGEQYVYRRGADVDFRRVRDLDQLEMEWVASSALALNSCEAPASGTEEHPESKPAA